MENDENPNNEKKIFLATIQKDVEYRRRLNPIKTRISQILLYDTEAALKFLIEYNDILKNTKTPGVDVYGSIAALENAIKDYEKEQGKEKLFEEESKTILQKANELKDNFKQLNTSELEKELNIIKNKYKENLTNYSDEDKNVLDKSIYSLQVKIIRRKINEGITDLHSFILEGEELNLVIAINDEINSLVNNPDLNTRMIINQIKISMINKTDIVYDVKVWKMLDLIQNEKKPEFQAKKEEIKKDESLPVIPKKNKMFSFLNKLFPKKEKSENKRITAARTLKIGYEIFNTTDLIQINVNWIANKVPNSDLIKFEKKYIEDNNIRTNKIYMTDPKTLVYNEFEKIQNKDKETRIGCYTSRTRKVNVLKILQVSDQKDKNIRYSITIAYGDRDHKESMIVGEIAKKYIEIIDYAEMLDSIVKSDIKQQLYDELGNYYEKILSKNRVLALSDESIYSNLLKSYEAVKKQYQNAFEEFRNSENNKRNEFYSLNVEKEENNEDSNEGVIIEETSEMLSGSNILQ